MVQTAAMATPVWVYNPLPAALGHYEVELVDVLASGGLNTRSAGAASAEVDGAGRARRALAAAKDVASRYRASRLTGRVLVCWPTFGLLEPLLWATAGRSCRITVIVHDPTPLRRQIGMGPLARRLGRSAARVRGIDVVVHSRPAADELARTGWNDLVQLPHPALRRTVAPRPESKKVLVAGQYKPARDLQLLAKLGPMLRGAGLEPQITGRGWPDVPGWDVEEGFLSEPVLDERILDSAAVLIPYSHFYQSGIAIRALELGVPVVGPRHPFLEDVLGADWPGLVTGDEVAAWDVAILEASRAADRLDAGLESYRHRCEQEWSAYLRR